MNPQSTGIAGVLARMARIILMTSGAVVATLGLAVVASGATAATAQARGHLLVLSDMPRGWTTEKGSNSASGSNSFPGAKQLAACIGVPAKLVASNPPEVDSPYFESKNGSLEVQDSISVFPSLKIAEAQLTAIENAKAPSCMTALVNAAPFRSQLASASGSGATIGTITVTRAAAANYAKGATALTLTIPITDQGVSISAKITEVFFIKGNLGQQISFNSYDAAFPPSLSRNLTAAAERRL
jgi:hypothetical protein